MAMGRVKSACGVKKSRKFTALVDFDKTMLVVSTALTGAYSLTGLPLNRDSRDIYQSGVLCRMKNRQYLAMAWLAAGSVLALQPGCAEAGAKPAPQPVPVAENPGWTGESGTASYYGKAHHGRRTSSGERFDQRALTAAHPWLPFGTRVKVTHEASGRSVIVVITDRLHSRRRVVDLSVAAAQQLGMIQQGIARVTLEPA